MVCKAPAREAGGGGEVSRVQNSAPRPNFVPHNLSAVSQEVSCLLSPGDTDSGSSLPRAPFPLPYPQEHPLRPYGIAYCRKTPYVPTSSPTVGSERPYVVPTWSRYPQVEDNALHCLEAARRRAQPPGKHPETRNPKPET